jgi:hypothetical protein
MVKLQFTIRWSINHVASQKQKLQSRHWPAPLPVCEQERSGNGAVFRTELEIDFSRRVLRERQPDVANMEKGRRAISKEMAKRIGPLFETDYRLFL